ncbi:MAG: peptidase inhibitor family I36 protein [Vicinamibacteraceae bacterium]
MSATAQTQEAAAPIPTEADAIDPMQAAEQAAEFGLDSAEAAALQKEVDELIIETGGVQLAANKVLWGDGSGVTTIPLPGEERVRLDGGLQAQASSAPCPVGRLCTYTERDYRGRMKEWFGCVYHHNFDYHGRWVSYVNNQTGGARAHFGNGAQYGDDSDGYWVATPPAFSANPASTKLLFATEIRPCD